MDPLEELKRSPDSLTHGRRMGGNKKKEKPGRVEKK